jgi:pyruvate dehydrogenase E1 component
MGLRDATRDARPARHDHHLAQLLDPDDRRAPIVTVHDAASHHLAWLAGVFGTRVVPVGVDEFGQSGTIADLHRVFDLSAEQIVNAALVATA